MTPFPLPLADIFGHWGSYGVYMLIGIAFGAVLEMSGFGNSMKLAGQFYFRDLTVLKVMFGGIIVAMVLVFAATAVGLTDYNLIYVNPTYMQPVIVGGLIMGAGFVIGGFCPGTSLVAAATLKKDGIMFVLGVAFGIFMFGETVDKFALFWNSSYMGRFTLPELFNVSTGVVVVGIVAIALFLFWGADKIEAAIGDDEVKGPSPKWSYGTAVGIFLLALIVMVIGQPTEQDRWSRIATEKNVLLAERAVQIHPGELLDNIHDTKINVVMLDVRAEADYNLFHILDARHTTMETLPDMLDELHQAEANTVFVTMSNDEELATAAWKYLQAESVPNVYILEGGINNWIATFGDTNLTERFNSGAGDDELCYIFDSAIGSNYDAAEPKPEAHELEYTPKIKLETKRAPASGGCG